MIKIENENALDPESIVHQQKRKRKEKTYQAYEYELPKNGIRSKLYSELTTHPILALFCFFFPQGTML